MNEEMDRALAHAAEAVDNVWNCADGMTLGELRKEFQKLRDQIDHYIQELGH